MSRTISKKHLLAGLAAAGVLGVGIAAPTVALADDKSTPSASASAEDQQDGQRPERTEQRQAFAEQLAQELGVPTEKVTAALEKLREQHKSQGRPDGEHRAGRGGDRGPKGSAEDRKEVLAERLTQAVKDGKLTQEQADAITAAVEAGVFGGPGGWGGPGGRGGHDAAGK
ncbi:hypothetical protein C1I95_09355 [Micromonospora craterilacus]|uniref:Uncharacterized protein n=1 Tax=Micromonospora craterilacus TaxID=1655439 RepID=A0A2W2EDG2_9ACTN|nr:hypothetical protein [Micromonospora craterilacus]PZG20553.1 hypothetical protein C1I95_09355 [Micromonospora craterilacus]